MTQDTEDVVALDMTPTGAFKLPRWQYQLRAAAACLEADPPLTREFRKSVSDMLGRHQTAIQSLSDRIDVLEGLQRRIITQYRNDMSGAHAEICKLQKLDPATHSWPDWTPQANTLRWFDELDRAALHQEGIAP